MAQPAKLELLGRAPDPIIEFARAHRRDLSSLGVAFRQFGVVVKLDRQYICSDGGAQCWKAPMASTCSCRLRVRYMSMILRSHFKGPDNAREDIAPAL